MIKLKTFALTMACVAGGFACVSGERVDTYSLASTGCDNDSGSSDAPSESSADTAPAETGSDSSAEAESGAQDSSTEASPDAAAEAEAGQDAAPDASACSIAIGAHVVRVDNWNMGTSPMTSSPVTTQATGSTFVLFIGTSASFTGVSDNKGNTYTRLGTPQLFCGCGNYYLDTYIAINAVGGVGHTFSLLKSTWPADESTLWAVEVTGGVNAVDAYVQGISTANPMSLPAGITTAGTCDMLFTFALDDNGAGWSFELPSAGWTQGDSDPLLTNESMGGGWSSMLAGAAGTYHGSLAACGNFNDSQQGCTVDPNLNAAGAAVAMLALRH